MHLMLSIAIVQASLWQNILLFALGQATLGTLVNACGSILYLPWYSARICIPAPPTPKMRSQLARWCSLDAYSSSSVGLDSHMQMQMHLQTQVSSKVQPHTQSLCHPHDGARTLQNASQHNATQHNAAQHNATQHNSTQCNSLQCNTMQHNTTRHQAKQYNKVQYTTLQYTTVRYNSIRWDTIRNTTIQYKTIQ